MTITGTFLPYAEGMLSSVAVLAYEGVSTFGLGVTAEVFGCDRRGEGIPRYEYFVTAAQPGVIRTDVGMPILVESGVDRLSSADLAVVVCWDEHRHKAARASACRAANGRGPWRPGAQPVHRGLRARRRRAARRPPGDHALEVRGRASQALSAGRCGSRGALRRRGPGDHQRGDGRRDRRLPARHPPGARRRGGQRDRPPHGGRPAPRRRAGAVRPGAGGRHDRRA